MKAVNKVILIGRVGKDPEIVYFDSGSGTGKAKTKFGLATDEGTSRDGAKITHWHNIVMWEKTAELAAQYIKKGRLVYIEGRLSYREYTDKQGQRQKITEIVAHDFSLLDAPKEAQQAPDGNDYDETDPADTDDIPF